MAGDNQNSVPETSVTKETIKGAAKGAAAPLVATGVTVAGGAAMLAAIVGPPVAAYKIASRNGSKGKGLAVAGIVLVGMAASAVTAAIGGMLGFGKGVAKSGSERMSIKERDEQAISDTIQAASQQAYMAGARDGQVRIMQELQKAQEAQAAHLPQQAGSFAAKVEQTKNSISPEAIARQRENAASASAQIG